MSEDRQTLLYYLRHSLTKPQPLPLLFSLSILVFAGMIGGGYYYYSANIGAVPSIQVSFMKRALNLYRDGNHTAAASEYQAAAAIWPINSRLAYNRGVNQLEAGKPAEAIETYKEFLKINPGDLNIRFGLGYSYAKAGNFSAAIEHMSLATALGPTVYFNLGAAYEAAGQLPQAAESYQLAAGVPGANEKYAAVMRRMRN